MLSTVRMSRVVSAGTTTSARERGPAGRRCAPRARVAGTQLAPPPVRARETRRATRAPRRRRGPRGVQVNISLSAGLWLFVGNYLVLWLYGSGCGIGDGRWTMRAAAGAPRAPRARASPRRAARLRRPLPNDFFSRCDVPASIRWAGSVERRADDVGTLRRSLPT